jgi:hypothetical protein
MITNDLLPIPLVQTATVAVNGTTTDEIDLGRGQQLFGIFVPSTFDGTTITLTASPSSGGTFVAVQDGYGSTFTLTTTASRYVPISDLRITGGLRYIKLVCGSTQTTSSTEFTLITRQL